MNKKLLLTVASCMLLSATKQFGMEKAGRPRAGSASHPTELAKLQTRDPKSLQFTYLLIEHPDGRKQGRSIVHDTTNGAVFLILQDIEPGSSCNPDSPVAAWHKIEEGRKGTSPADPVLAKAWEEIMKERDE